MQATRGGQRLGGVVRLGQSEERTPHVAGDATGPTPAPHPATG